MSSILMSHLEATRPTAPAQGKTCLASDRGSKVLRIVTRKSSKTRLFQWLKEGLGSGSDHSHPSLLRLGSDEVAKLNSSRRDSSNVLWQWTGKEMVIQLFGTIARHRFYKMQRKHTRNLTREAKSRLLSRAVVSSIDRTNTSSTLA